MKKEYLTEENYEKGKKKLKTIATVIILIGALIGGSLIATGIMRQVKINEKYSEESKLKISQKLDIEKQNLITKKTELEVKIEPVETQIKQLRRVKFDGFTDAYYERQDKIEELQKSISEETNNLEIINNVITNPNHTCVFKGESNSYISKYCSLYTELENLTESKKDFESFDNTPFYMFGGFVILASCMISLSIYMSSKGREINAFYTQQQMPIIQESVEKLSPTAGKVAKEITKGIKQGFKE